MSEQKKNTIHEDWTVVLLGGLIIILSIGGLILNVPVFSWNNSVELFDKVLSLDNMSAVFVQFILVLLIALIGAFLTGKALVLVPII